MNEVYNRTDERIVVPDQRQKKLNLPFTAEEVTQWELEKKQNKEALEDFRRRQRDFEEVCDEKASLLGLKRYPGSGGFGGGFYVEPSHSDTVLPSVFWIGKKNGEDEVEMEQHEIKFPVNSMSELASAIESVDILYPRLENAIVADRHGTEGLVDFLRKNKGSVND